MMHLRERLFTVVLASLFFLSLLQLLDISQIMYFPMKNRLIYSLRFDLGFDLFLILLFVSFLVLALLLWRRDFLGVFVSSVITTFVHFFFGFEMAVVVFSLIQVIWSLYRFVGFLEFLLSLFVLITGFEAFALMHWLLLPFGLRTPLSWFADFELDLFYITACVAPVIVSIIMCMWFLKPLSNYLGFDKRLKVESSDNLEIFSNIGIHHTHILGIAIFLAVIGALYPYSPAINPSATPVGVDVPLYVDWMAEVEKNLSSAFTVERGSRPLILLLIYCFEHGFRVNSLEIIKYFPVLLNPLLILSVYFMVSQVYQNSEFAALSSLLTGLGTNITVGMFSYFLANILGLILIYTALGFLFKTIMTNNKFYLILASIFGSLTIFSHPWTFIQYYIVIALFLGYNHFVEKRFEGDKTIFIFLIITGLIDLIKEVFVKGFGGYNSISLINLKLINVINFWQNNIIVFRLRFGGLLSNTIFLCIAAFGFYKIDRKHYYNAFLTFLLALSSIYYFLGNEVIKSRILYNIPFSIFAAYGILIFLRSEDNHNKKLIFVLFFILYMFVYLFRSLGNLI